MGFSRVPLSDAAPALEQGQETGADVGLRHCGAA
jgi:hypothetical protein